MDFQTLAYPLDIFKSRLTKQTHDYLTAAYSTPGSTRLSSSQTADSAADNDAEVPRIMAVLNPLNLTKMEKLMIVNHRPVGPMELDCIVEECEERLGGEEGVEKLLAQLQGAYGERA